MPLVSRLANSTSSLIIDKQPRYMSPNENLIQKAPKINRIQTAMAEPDKKALVRVYSNRAEERLAKCENGKALGQILSQTEPSLEDVLAPWRVFYEPWESVDTEL